ncbi:MAG: Na+/H+ antiporter subunit E [Thermomicrobiales bacterium]
MSRWLLSVLILTAVYCLALASRSAWDIATGVVISVGVLAAFRQFMFPGAALGVSDVVNRAMQVPRLMVATAVDIMRGTVAISRVVLSRDPSRNSGFIDLPIGERSASGLAVNTLLNTLSPGTVLVDVDRDAETWTIHAIDVTDPEAVRDDIASFYQKYQRPVWP